MFFTRQSFKFAHIQNHSYIHRDNFFCLNKSNSSPSKSQIKYLKLCFSKLLTKLQDRRNGFQCGGAMEH